MPGPLRKGLAHVGFFIWRTARHDGEVRYCLYSCPSPDRHYCAHSEALRRQPDALFGRRPEPAAPAFGTRFGSGRRQAPPRPDPPRQFRAPAPDRRPHRRRGRNQYQPDRRAAGRQSGSPSAHCADCRHRCTGIVARAGADVRRSAADARAGTGTRPAPARTASHATSCSRSSTPARASACAATACGVPRTGTDSARTTPDPSRRARGFHAAAAASSPYRTARRTAPRAASRAASGTAGRATARACGLHAAASASAANRTASGTARRAAAGTGIHPASAAASRTPARTPARATSGAGCLYAPSAATGTTGAAAGACRDDSTAAPRAA